MKLLKASTTLQNKTTLNEFVFFFFHFAKTHLAKEKKLSK